MDPSGLPWGISLVPRGCDVGLSGLPCRVSLVPIGCAVGLCGLCRGWCVWFLEDLGWVCGLSYDGFLWVPKDEGWVCLAILEATLWSLEDVIWVCLASLEGSLWSPEDVGWWYLVLPLAGFLHGQGGTLQSLLGHLGGLVLALTPSLLTPSPLLFDVERGQLGALGQWLHTGPASHHHLVAAECVAVGWLPPHRHRGHLRQEPRRPLRRTLSYQEHRPGDPAPALVQVHPGAHDHWWLPALQVSPPFLSATLLRRGRGGGDCPGSAPPSMMALGRGGPGLSVVL